MYLIENSTIGIFCGSMYPEKGLDFIIKACIEIKKEIKNFVMLFIGSGLDDYKIKESSSAYKWIYYLGNEAPRRKQRGILLTNMSSSWDFEIFKMFCYCYFVPMGLCMCKANKISPQAAGYLP